MSESPRTSLPTDVGTSVSYGRHIVQYSPEYSLCTGCVSCTIMCGLTHEGFTGHGNSRIQVELGTRSLIHHILSCQQCEDHPCYEACPKKDEAMCLDPETGIVYVNEDACIGCALCQKNCRFTPSRIAMKRNSDRRKWKAVKCDLCRGNPEGPQCVKWCPVRCLGLSDESQLCADGWWPKDACACGGAEDERPGADTESK